MEKDLYKFIREDDEIRELIKRGNANLGVLGITDHSEIHTTLVAKNAAWILKEFGYDAHSQQLAKIAGYMHDIGNAINRTRHAEYGALLANDILKRYNISVEDRVEIVTCISNHDESTGGSVDAISAALIIADKTDVRRNRVRIKDKAAFDIHDRVNYAVTEAVLSIDMEKKVITLQLTIDEESCSMYEYFDIFLGRMQMCRHAAEMLGARFKLMANGSKVL
ncbi:MAG: HD domain-containing protein [Lachnospiraceae bacterium]|nr:HD domain-containing protein [Lachnospiraceae bacterium]